VVRDHSASLRDFRIVRDDGTSIAICTKILARVEAKSRNVAEGADSFSVQLRSVRLGAILDYLEAMPTRKRRKLWHWSGLPIQVHGHYRCRARRKPPFHIGKIE
jgi:hypothetical protein